MTTDYSGVVGGPGHADQPNVARAVVAIPPKSPTDSMEVALVGYTSQYTYEIPPGNWAPRGNTLPTLGATCVVCFDHPNGDAWVPMWEGVDVYPGNSPGSLANVGDVKMTVSSTAPPGWLLCNGQAVSRATYSALYAALGGASSQWGQGDGSTTFNVPNMQNRMPIGASGTYPLGTIGGEATHVLTKPEMPVHNHAGFTGGGQTGSGATTTATQTGSGTTGTANTGYTDTNHYHNLVGNTGTESAWHQHGGTTDGPAWQSNDVYSGAGTVQFKAMTYNVNFVGGDNRKFADFVHTHTFTSGNQNTLHTHALPANTDWQSNSYNNSNHLHSIPGLSVPNLSIPALAIPNLAVPPLTISNDGGGTAHNNMPPFAAVNYLIKY